MNKQAEQEPRPNLIRAAEIAIAEETFSHPWNPASEIIGTRVSKMTGLRRTGVSRVRVAPGKESFVYHAHEREEEWIYILSGRGVARIDGEEMEVHAGDFMGFPTPSVAHHLKNPFDVELVYLMGGESRQVEIAEFPDLGKRMLRRGANIEIYDASDARPFGADVDV